MEPGKLKPEKDRGEPGGRDTRKRSHWVTGDQALIRAAAGPPGPALPNSTLLF